MSEMDDDEYDEEMRDIAELDERGAAEQGGLVQGLAIFLAGEIAGKVWPFDGPQSYDKAARSREYWRGMARETLAEIARLRAAISQGGSVE